VRGYYPNIPKSYAGCVVDPTSSTKNRISLRDPLHGLDIVNDNGAAIASGTLNDEIWYTFSSPANGPCGYVDEHAT
jgi:hypothetical protein